jgi:hypothetical protein
MGSVLQSITADTTTYGLQHFLKNCVSENNNTTEAKLMPSHPKIKCTFLQSL